MIHIDSSSCMCSEVMPSLAELHTRREKYSPPANIFDIIKEK